MGFALFFFGKISKGFLLWDHHRRVDIVTHGSGTFVHGYTGLTEGYMAELKSSKVCAIASAANSNSHRRRISRVKCAAGRDKSAGRVGMW